MSDWKFNTCDSCEFCVAAEVSIDSRWECRRFPPQTTFNKRGDDRSYYAPFYPRVANKQDIHCNKNGSPINMPACAEYKPRRIEPPTRKLEV